jgi:cytochrome c-type biogenesis protein CcmH/NrfF
MTALYACASHLLVDLPLFGAPALMVILAVALITRAERRRARGGSPSTPGPRQDARLPASSGT